MSVEGGFRLGNTAAAGIGEEAPQEIAHPKRADDRNNKTAPGCATRGIEARTKSFRDEDEGDDEQADEGPDDKGQDKEDLFLAVLNERSPSAQRRLPKRAFGRVFRHGLA